MPRAAVATALLVLAVALAGCGLGPGKKMPGGARLEVTPDFRQSQLYATTVPTIRKDETVMRFLESKRRVTTSYGGKFVDSIDGLATHGAGGARGRVFFVQGVR